MSKSIKNTVSSDFTTIVRPSAQTPARPLLEPPRRVPPLLRPQPEGEGVVGIGIIALRVADAEPVPEAVGGEEEAKDACGILVGDDSHGCPPLKRTSDPVANAGM